VSVEINGDNSGGESGGVKQWGVEAEATTRDAYTWVRCLFSKITSSGKWVGIVLSYIRPNFQIHNHAPTREILQSKT
jgi:hypothetical protein